MPASETPAGGRGLENPGGRRVQNNSPTGRGQRVVFVPANVTGCVVVDLRRPAKGDRFEFGEVGRRLHRACAGITTSTVLQIKVSESTPEFDISVPAGIRIQVSAPDTATVSRWMNIISGAVV